MDLLNRLTINTRMTAFAGIIIFSIITIALIININLSRLEEGFTEYRDAGVSGELYVVKISRDMNYVSRLGRSIMLGDDYQKNFDKLEKRIADIYSHFENLKSTSSAINDDQLSQTIQQAVAKSEQDTRAFLEDSRSRMSALANVERTPEVLQQAWQGYKKGATPVANAARASFKQLIELQDNMMHVIESREDAAIKKLERLVISMSTVVLLIALGLMYVVSKSITRPLSNLKSTIESIEKDSDLTKEINITSSDELGQAAESFNRMLLKFRGIIQQVANTTQTISLSTEQVSTISRETEGGAQQQRMQLSTVASSIEDMAMTVQKISQQATEAASSAENANSAAQEGQDVVNQTVRGISELSNDIDRAADVVNRLEQGTDDIGTVLEVIKGIADQTNLLALNAAIEAARAGEQGRGFAVVADEVRTLAGRTRQSTEEIQAMIESLQGGAREAVNVMNQSREQAGNVVNCANTAGNSLVSITDAVVAITGMNTNIAQATVEQNTVTESVNQSVASISHEADKSADGAKKTTEAISELSVLSNQLQSMVSKFRA